MLKASLFNIEEKKEDQRRAVMQLTPEERLLLTLDLMDLTIALSKDKMPPPPPDDGIEWIELRFKNEQSD